MMKIKDFWKKYKAKIILVLGFILVIILSFEAGILKGQKMPQNPIIIEKPIQAASIDSTSQNASQEQNLPQEKSEKNILPIEQSAPTNKQNCAFVGSKNSNKYHLPTCRWAKNIKPENLVCFSSESDANSKGYLPDKNCIK